MAKGLLGSATIAASSPTNTSVVAYTVPAGISHAVVHITISPKTQFDSSGSNNTAAVTVNGATVLTPAISAGGSQVINTFSNSLSMMLSPGDIVRIIGGNTLFDNSVTVSGYEVA